MKLFKDELFSLQIDPTNGKDPGLILSIYSSGDFLVETTSPFSMNEKRTLVNCFTILDKSIMASVGELTKKLSQDLTDAPSDLLVPDYKGSQYTLSLLGRLYNGDYAYTDIPSFNRNGDCPTQILKNV